jgi:hypothetical protein
MLLSLNGVIVVAVEADSQGSSKALKALLLLLLPTLLLNLWLNKLGIYKEIPSRTLVVPKDLGNNNNLDPKTL